MTNRLYFEPDELLGSRGRSRELRSRTALRPDNASGGDVALSWWLFEGLNEQEQAGSTK